MEKDDDSKESVSGIVEETAERTDKQILDQAKERFQTVLDANAGERELQGDDARFADEDQWEAEIRTARESAPNGS